MNAEGTTITFFHLEEVLTKYWLFSALVSGNISHSNVDVKILPGLVKNTKWKVNTSLGIQQASQQNFPPMRVEELFPKHFFSFKVANLKIKSYWFVLRNSLWLNPKLLLIINQAMQGKIKNFRHFIYKRNSYKAIIPDLQVKISHTHTHSNSL